MLNGRFARRPGFRRVPRTAAPLLLLLLLWAVPAAATSYVPIEDGALADQAAAIAEVRVEAVEPARGVGRPATDYRVTVLRSLKGDLGDSLVLREPGGEGENGLQLRIEGVPAFRPGDPALVFLVAHDDGTYGILHLLLGAFPASEVAGRRVVLRPLVGATAVRRRPAGDPAPLAMAAGEDQPRDLDRFEAWLADRSAGRTRPADYFVDLPAESRRSLVERFTLIPDRNRHLRWEEFDVGASIPFAANVNGQPGVPGGGFDEFQRALAAWNDESHTSISYNYTGTTPATGGLKTFDGVNAILFDDPNKEIDGAFNCTAGGILAVSSPWTRGFFTFFQDEIFFQIVGADIITNDNISCYLARTGDPGKAAEEIFAHELGHTLGLLHACGDLLSPPCTDPVKNDALMRSFVHGDGRGARLGTDDVAGIRYLYDPSRRATTACRPSSTALCLANRRFKAELFWHNQFDRSQGLGQAVPATDATGYFSFGDPANLELLVKVLNFGGTFKVFYGELTNLQFTLTLTDTETGVIKSYRNTTGDCGAVDQSFFDLAPGAATAATAAADTADAVGITPRRGSTGACRPDRQTLCLLDNRFAVRVLWQNPFDSSTGSGGPAALSDLVGTFYFTDRNNVELMVKIVPFPDRLAFFYGALSDFAYTIFVTDTASGVIKTYNGAPSRLCGGLDNSAF